MKISRNFRLNKFVELNYSNVFYINHEHFDFALKKPKMYHKFFYFQKI